MSEPPKVSVLVTGANGFIGRAVCRALAERGMVVRAAVRRPGLARHATDEVIIDDVGPATSWSAALRDIDVVVHLAARAHVLRETSADPLAEFRRVNRDGTRHLAAEALQHGVKRFVFVSSIGVNGDGGECAYDETSPPRPQSPYGVSKWEAEQALGALGREPGLEMVVVRPPLVYGPGVPGNFRQLLKWTQRGIPLPLGATSNQRSFIYVDNLAELIALCVVRREAAGELFLAGDAPALSTTELIQKIARAMERSPRLFPVPGRWLGPAARLLGRRRAWQQLFGSLVVNADKASERLGWSSRVDLDEGLRRTIAWYRDANR